MIRQCRLCTNREVIPDPKERGTKIIALGPRKPNLLLRRENHFLATINTIHIFYTRPLFIVLKKISIPPMIKP